jgi:hypothetical protein
MAAFAGTVAARCSAHEQAEEKRNDRDPKSVYELPLSVPRRDTSLNPRAATSLWSHHPQVLLKDSDPDRTHRLWCIGFGRGSLTFPLLHGHARLEFSGFEVSRAGGGAEPSDSSSARARSAANSFGVL